LKLLTTHPRNQTSHLYDESILDEVFEKVVNQYPILFEQLEARMNEFSGMETGLGQKSLQAIADVVYSNAHVQDAKIFGSRAIGNFRCEGEMLREGHYDEGNWRCEGLSDD
jgi:hypothetical protein